MKFEETKKVISIKYCKVTNVFIYFLCENDNVVYVGQTKCGLSRPYAHKDKKFDEIKILLCDENELDFLEDKYIKKYKPKYNKVPNYKMNYTLKAAKEEIRNCFGTKNFTLTHLKKIIQLLNIDLYLYNCVPFLSKKDLYKIIDYIEETGEYD